MTNKKEIVAKLLDIIHSLSAWEKEDREYKSFSHREADLLITLRPICRNYDMMSELGVMGVMREPERAAALRILGYVTPDFHPLNLQQPWEMRLHDHEHRLSVLEGEARIHTDKALSELNQRLGVLEGVAQFPDDGTMTPSPSPKRGSAPTESPQPS